MLQLLKPVCLEPVLCSERSRCNEKLVHHHKEEPPVAAARESLRAAVQTHTAKTENI